MGITNLNRNNIAFAFKLVNENENALMNGNVTDFIRNQERQWKPGHIQLLRRVVRFLKENPTKLPLLIDNELIDIYVKWTIQKKTTRNDPIDYTKVDSFR